MFKNKIYFSVIFLLLFFIGVGYAILNSNISIKGKSNIRKNVWDIRFENIKLKKGSATSNLPEFTNDTIIINTTFNNPGDYYSFTFDIFNAGTLNATIEDIELVTDMTSEQYKICNYEISYLNGDSVLEAQYLMAGERRSLSVYLEYKKDIEIDDLPKDISSISMTFKINYIQTPDNPDANLIVMNKSWVQSPGISLYDALSIKYEEMAAQNYTSFPRPSSEYVVVDPDYSTVFVDENGKLLNLKETIIFGARVYKSIIYGVGAKITEEKIRNDDYVTAFVNVNQILEGSWIGTGGNEYIPAFVDTSDTYVEVMHAIYPNGYLFGDSSLIESFEQELIDEYVLGFPSGQEAGGCENGTVHKFFGFMDEDNNLLKMTDKVNHMDKRKVVMFGIEDSTMTWEEAKNAVESQLEVMLKEQGLLISE